ncbi:MAG: DUF1294 domain-containing protein [bacterium]|nr:DUF1294 domain-containing protein [bacterium]
MEREKGTLVRWDDDKGYGFIRPHNGKEDIFLHMKSLPHFQRRPKIGDVLTYGVGVDGRQRYYACSAKINRFAWSFFSLCCFGLTLLFGVYVYLVFQQTLPVHPLAIYAAMSLITIWAYSRDKRAAQSGAWRSREIRLHLLEFLGGWPGAFLAQLFYRHKSRKFSYQIVFWLIVAAHGFLWYHILTNQDIYRPYQELATEKVNLSIVQIRKGILQLVEREDFSPDLTDGESAEKIEEDSAPDVTSEKLAEKPVKKPETAKPGRRSTIRYDRLARILEGVVQEIRPGEGIIVSLESETGTVGILDASTLVKDFAARFSPGERIQVAVGTIRIEGKQKRIELVLVEK